MLTGTGGRIMEMMSNGRVDALIDHLYEEAEGAIRAHAVYRVEIVHSYDRSAAYVAEWVEADSAEEAAARLLERSAKLGRFGVSLDDNVCVVARG